MTSGPIVTAALALFIAAAGGIAWWWTRTSEAAPDVPQTAVEPDPAPPADAAPPPPVPPAPARVAITPEDTQFGTSVLRLLAGPRDLIVSNLGGEPVTIADVALSGANAADFSIRENGCPSTLTNGDSCRVAIGFTPSAEGMRNALLTVIGQDGVSRWAARLAGAGVPPERRLIDVPIELKFGSRTVKTAGGLEELTIRNPGSAALTIARAEKGGDQGDDFTVAQDECSGTTLPRLGECVIRVRFVPSGVGPRAGRLAIVDNGEGSPHVVALLGEGSAAPTPRPRVTPDVLDFRPQVVQVASAPETITITNDGNGPLVIGRVTVQGVHGSDFRIVSNSCEGTTLAPTSPGCTIGLGFAPAGVGPRAATLTLEHNAGDTNNTVALLGTALAPPRPVAQVDPPVVRFDRRLQATESDATPVSIRNIGGGTLVVSRVGVTGAHVTDFQVENRCAGSTMARGQPPCQLFVRFVPQGPGPRRAELVVTDNSGEPPQHVVLTGTADTPGRLDVRPARVDFDALKLGAAATSPPITLSNGGTLSLTVDAVSVTGPNAADFTLARPCREPTLQGNSSCVLEVRFAPSAHGTRTATLRVTSADGTTREVPLSGSGLGIVQLVVPASLRLGVVDVRSTASPQRVPVRNEGTAPVTLGAVRLEGDAREFQVDPGNDCAGATLAPKDTCAIEVRFTPLAASTRTATLVIAEATGTLHSVALEGGGRTQPPPDAGRPVTPQPPDRGNQPTPGGGAPGFPTFPVDPLIPRPPDPGNGPRPRLPEILSFTAVRGGLCYTVESATKGTINQGVGPVAVGIDERCTRVSPSRTTTYLLTVENPVGRAQRTVTVSVESGETPRPKEPQLRFVPDRLELGALAGGATLNQTLPRPGLDASDTFTIQNVGEAAATISRIALDGRDRSDFFITASPACRRLEAGQTCEVRVAFRPSDPGTSSAVVMVEHNAPRSPNQLPLTGVARAGGPVPGKPPEIEFQPARLEFGPWFMPAPPTGSSRGVTRPPPLPPAAASRDIRVRNRGGSAATIAAVRVEGANARDFTVSGSCTRLEPGQTCELSVIFWPVGGVGSRVAVVAVDHNAPGARQIPLSGDVRFREDPGRGEVEPPPAPRILSFRVEGASGKWAFCYEIANAARAFISPMGQDVPVGTRRQCVPVSPPPRRTTNYVLTAVGPGGQDRESTTIQVKESTPTTKEPGPTPLPGGQLSQPDPTLKRPVPRTPTTDRPTTRQPPPPARGATRPPPPPAEKGTVRRGLASHRTGSMRRTSR